MFLDEETAFVKSQIEHHIRSIAHYEKRGDLQKVSRHRGILRRFEEILPKMEQLQNGGIVAPAKAPDSTKIGSRFGDISEIPEELRAQLVSIQYDPLEQQIVDVVNNVLGKFASIDEIMVALWRVHGDLHQREMIANKIYRMTRKELLFSVAGRKGVYSTVESEATSSDDVSEDNTGADQ